MAGSRKRRTVDPSRIAATYEERRTASLIPYVRNPRQHPHAQIVQLAESIREFGFTMPILIDEGGEVIAGHGRLMAAKHLGLEAVPCITAAGWTDAKRRAYVIADNRLAENATWDKSLLRVELGELREMGVDLDVLGFAAKEIDEMFAPAESPAPAPETTFAIMVLCASKAEQRRELKALRAAGKRVKAMVA